MKTTLNPYLNFMGQTGEAMKFYQSVLGGELVMQTFAESGMPCPDEDKDKIIHAMLTIGDMVIMASDGDKDHPVRMGDNIHMSLVGTDRASLTDIFNKMTEGGKVDMPLAKQFWGDVYGQLTDKFGVHWMVNISSGSRRRNNDLIFEDPAGNILEGLGDLK